MKATGKTYNSNAFRNPNHPKSDVESFLSFGWPKMRKGHVAQKFGDNLEGVDKAYKVLTLIKVKREDCRK